eukprot:COSAG06_NODE_12507_length_1372_cov_1.460330_1_plen_162_part_00
MCAVVRSLFEDGWDQRQREVQALLPSESRELLPDAMTWVAACQQHRSSRRAESVHVVVREQAPLGLNQIVHEGGECFRLAAERSGEADVVESQVAAWAAAGRRARRSQSAVSQPLLRCVSRINWRHRTARGRAALPEGGQQADSAGSAAPARRHEVGNSLC